MNSLIISYHILKAQFKNMISNIKSMFKSKPKLDQKPCYTSEVEIANYYILNLLKEIKVIDFNSKTFNSYNNMLQILDAYPAIKTIFISTFVQNTIIKMHEKYPNHLIYIEDFNPSKLIIKTHLIDIKVFKEIFVISDPKHRELFQEIIEDPDTIGLKIVESSDNQGYSLLEQKYTNGVVSYDKVIQANSSLKSIFDIINNNKDVMLYYMNETFTNKVIQELPNINNQILDVLLSGKPIDDFIIINKIL